MYDPSMIDETPDDTERDAERRAILRTIARDVGMSEDAIERVIPESPILREIAELRASDPAQFARMTVAHLNR